MPHLYTCPHCQIETYVEDRFRGCRGSCASCGMSIEIPFFQIDPAVVQGGTAVGLGASQGLGSSQGMGGAAAVNGNAAMDMKRLLPMAIFGLIAVILTIFVLAWVVEYGGSSFRRIASRRTRSVSISNLEQITKALNAYAKDFGTYPPPFIPDANGTPMHSWRVLILPYMDEVELSRSYDRNLPWNDPKNLAVQYQIPSAFQHPNANDGTWSMESSYYLVTGPGTLFPPKGPLSPDDVLDDPSQTVLVVEARPNTPSQIWTEPIDLSFNTITGDISAGGPTEIGGWSNAGATVGTVDGRGYFLSESMNPAEVRALLTPAGGERLRDDTLN